MNLTVVKYSSRLGRAILTFHPNWWVWSVSIRTCLPPHARAAHRFPTNPASPGRLGDQDPSGPNRRKPRCAVNASQHTCDGHASWSALTIFGRVKPAGQFSLDGKRCETGRVGRAGCACAPRFPRTRRATGQRIPPQKRLRSAEIAGA